MVEDLSRRYDDYDHAMYIKAVSDHLGEGPFWFFVDNLSYDRGPTFLVNLSRLSRLLGTQYPTDNTLSSDQAPGLLLSITPQSTDDDLRPSRPRRYTSIVTDDPFRTRPSVRTNNLIPVLEDYDDSSTLCQSCEDEGHNKRKNFFLNWLKEESILHRLSNLVKERMENLNIE
ncbi:hypothetical protein ACJ73_06263 [Blastomyces percursus]|uniref:Uncharacterized protein n=1 Tax=Blastomyces percursus TaxID=1658174 RepID=A0A1J9Q1D5_9EURO|nr:hypothetical protein ACJ73_06263 [Blastomyces percursus]